MSDHHLGVIYGNVGSTSFRFAVRDPALKRNDYVAVDHEGVGRVLAQVADVTRETDLTFDQAQSLAHRDDEREARAVKDRLTAQAKVVGYRDDRGLLQSPSTPFRAGSFVHAADAALIADVFGLPHRADGRIRGAYIGHVRGYGIPVVLDPNVLVQKHVSVLAKTGAGKSYVVGVLMEELIRHRVPIVVVDPHGEHGSLAHPNGDEREFPAMRRFGVKPRAYADRIRSFSPDTLANPGSVPLRLDGRDLSTQELQDLLGTRLTNTQAGILHQSLQHLRESTRSYTLEDILEAVREHDSSARWGLLSTLESLRSLGVFEGEGTAPESLVARDQVSVLNLRGSPPHVQEIVVARLAKSLFEARKRGEVPPFMFVVEEAHNFCPERTFSNATSGDVLRTIASEGRKFGMGLTIISQRPAKVDKNVISQCNTEVILKVTNPNDLKALVASVEGLTSDMEDEIQRLPVGVAVVSHPPIAMPLLVEVRPRETRHGGRSVQVVEDDVPEHEAPPPAVVAPPEPPAPEPRRQRVPPPEPTRTLPTPYAPRETAPEPTALPPKAAHLVLSAREAAEALEHGDPEAMAKVRVTRLMKEVADLGESLLALELEHPDVRKALRRLGEAAEPYRARLVPADERRGLFARLRGR